MNQLLALYIIDLCLLPALTFGLFLSIRVCCLSQPLVNYSGYQYLPLALASGYYPWQMCLLPGLTSFQCPSYRPFWCDPQSSSLTQFDDLLTQTPCGPWYLGYGEPKSCNLGSKP